MHPMNGKTVLVTGASAGIGRVAAKELARAGARVVMVTREGAKGEAAFREVVAASSADRVDRLTADLSSMASVRDLAARFRAGHDRLDVLVNNAGAVNPTREVTVDGYERTFATNHLAYFLLTDLLLDVLKASAPSRVVNVASEAHRWPGMNFDDLMFERGWNPWRAYGQSKLANILFTFELARRLEGTGVTANVLHPGMVRSHFGLGFQGWMSWVLRAVYAFGISPESGAATTVYLASSPEVEGVSGRYFAKRRPIAPSRDALDPAAARRLWEISEDLVRL
jgi:NAD(P)-dependent dehydrogenase (short-subunit alcohol dehydrogenase family)